MTLTCYVDIMINRTRITVYMHANSDVTRYSDIFICSSSSGGGDNRRV